MKKQIFVSLIVLLILPTCLQAVRVNPASGPYYVGQEIRFAGSDMAWDDYTGYIHYGDGSVGSDVDYSSWLTHVYRNPGRYAVRITLAAPNQRSRGLSGIQYLPPADESMVITIQDNRSIQVSPANPVAGQMITFTAVNFNTPDNIRWEMGDGTIYRQKAAASPHGSSVVTHVYNSPGSFQVKAYDWNGSGTFTPVSLAVSIGAPSRRIEYQPLSPREDEPVYFQAVNFIQTGAIHWNFGDGTQEVNGTQVVHRFQQAGTLTVSAVDGSLSHSPVTVSVPVLPENRFITLSAPEIRINELLTVTGTNFRSDLIFWDFGDGEQVTAGHQVTHVYSVAGSYTIVARDENGESQKRFTATVQVRGIDDEIMIEIAEIRLDNGKYYKVVPRNTKSLYAVLRMKMGGTGAVSGRWIVDGYPYEYFNEVSIQGEMKEIRTREIPGLPVLEPGLHTITLQLTRPADVNLTFPVLKYFVLPYENIIETVAPENGFVAKEKEIPEFTWKRPVGAVRYEVAFSNNLYTILYNSAELHWQDAGIELKFTPDLDVWNHIRRNRWTYWKVRALDGAGQVVAESGIQEIKVIVATAEIAIQSVTDLEGNSLELLGGQVRSKAEFMLVRGSLVYAADAEFLVLRVFADQTPVDRLVFRNVRKGQRLEFETSIPHDGDTGVLFQLLKTSSPAVVVGIHNLRLKRPAGTL